MTVQTELESRAGSACELCGATGDGLNVYEVPPTSDGGADACILICATCRTGFDTAEAPDVHHWRCLNESMWSQVPAVQVMAWRMLNRLSTEAWAAELLDMLYFDEETQAWAGAMETEAAADDALRHVDANGAVLAAGDTVTLIKDLNVKGANFTAKRGTAVRGISLVADNDQQIEGRVNGQQIVILTEFVRKSN